MVVFTAPGDGLSVGGALDPDDPPDGVDVVPTAVAVLVTDAVGLLVAVGVRVALAVGITLLVGVGWGVFVASASHDRLSDLVLKLESTRKCGGDQFPSGSA